MGNPFERTYREARYVVALSDGELEFGIDDRLEALAGRKFALLTAYNPGTDRPGPGENAVANARLLRRLAVTGMEVTGARGMSPDGSHVEPSFAVFDITRDAALALAREFGQAAIVWFDGRTAQLAWTGEAEAARDT